MKSLKDFINEKLTVKLSREDILDDLVKTAGDREPDFLDDRGEWNPSDEGFDNFDTTDGKSFDYVEHLKSETADFAVAGWKVEDENDFPSDEIRKIWESSKPEEVLKMKKYFFKKVEAKYEGTYVRIVICTVNEKFDTYMFVIVE